MRRFERTVGGTMKIGSGTGGHLACGTDALEGGGLDAVERSLRESAAGVKRLVSPRQPMAVGIRLSARAAAELAAPPRLEGFQRLLAELGLYVFTVDAFPGSAPAFRPDWLEFERLRYTGLVSCLLARLLPDGLEGSVSTVPGGCAARVASDAQEQTVAENLMAAAEELWKLASVEGRVVALALEPEPSAWLDSVEKTVGFLETQILCRRSVSRFGRRLGLGPADAEQALRKHLGLCIDACHLAANFEDPEEAVHVARGRGVRIAKAQLSAGIEARWERGVAEIRRELGRLAAPEGLRPVKEKPGDLRYEDLPEALAAGPSSDGSVWRVRCNVPMHVKKVGALATTQPIARRLVSALRTLPHPLHLEVGTYSAAVLPAEERAAGLERSLAKELRWAAKAVSEN